jgi:hypothetical protein
MKSTRTPIRGAFSHNMSTSTTSAIQATLAALAGNQLPIVSNIVTIPRDGFYKMSIDASYINAAGSNYYAQVQVNGATQLLGSGNQNVVASAPVSSESRIVWCKAGDRVQVVSAHNEGSAVVRSVVGNFFIEEIVS